MSIIDSLGQLSSSSHLQYPKWSKATQRLDRPYEVSLRPRSTEWAAEVVGSLEIQYLPPIL